MILVYVDLTMTFASSLLPISLTTVEHYMEDKGKKAFDMIYEKIQEKDDFFVQDDKCVIRIEYKSKLISRDSTNVARTRKKYQFITLVIKILN